MYLIHVLLNTDYVTVLLRVQILHDITALANVGDGITRVIAFERVKNRTRCFDGSISQ